VSESYSTQYMGRGGKQKYWYNIAQRGVL